MSERRRDGWTLGWVVAALALATAANYLGWLGWDQLRDRVPGTGRSSGPYQPWQVVGLVVVIAGLAAFAGWRRHPWVAIVVVPVVTTGCWIWDATTGPHDPLQAGASLWPVGAVLVAVGVFALVGVTTGAAAGIQRAR